MQVNINWDKFDSDLYRPLVVNEVPDFNPGTIAYDDYWDEQDRRCLEGFKPTSFMPKITNEHYFYLNMCKIQLLESGAKRKSKGSPFYRELDRRLFNEIYDAKQNNFGLIVGKPRRVGLSWVGSCTSTYELKFYREAQVGVAAGQDDKAQDFYEKVKYLLKNIQPQYASGIITKNEKEIKLGYEYTENKQKNEGGLLSQMFMKTMYAKPTGFEGKSLSLAIFEEAGLFEDLIAAYKSTEPCFKEGSIQFGTPIIYGTGGEIDKGSKGYRAMWYSKREAYNLKKVFVSASDYYPGDGIPDKKTGKRISFFDFKTGRTNHKLAKEYIIKERKAKEQSEGFVKHIQSYPLKESDIFIKDTGGLLNRRKLQSQLQNLENCPYEQTLGRLEWETTDSETLKLVAKARNLKEKDKIHFNRGSKIVFIKDDFGTVHKILDPIKRKEHLPYNPDIAGCDSYDDEVDLTKEKHSLGATIGYRVFHGNTGEYDMPTSYILDRGTSDADDEFYSQTLRLCVYYDMEVLVEHTKVAIIGYFKDVGAYRHLKGRPEIDGYKSAAVNQYGFKMPNQYAFKLVTGLLKAEVNENFNKIWFAEILEHLIDFGEVNSDLGSAYGMVMVYKLDMFGEITEGIDESANDTSLLHGMGRYVVENGSAVWKTYGESNDLFDSGGIEYFNPEVDLDNEDYDRFKNRYNNEKEKMKEDRNEILKKYGNDIMAFTLNEVQDKSR